MSAEWFYFAIATRANRAFRERVPAHLAAAHGVDWSAGPQLVRVERGYRLYRIQRPVHA